MFSPNFVLFITITLSVLFSDSLNAYIKPKTSISGDVKFLDDLVTNFFPLGDKYGGLPENVISMGRYCAEYVAKGLSTLGYTTLRYPHKFLLKAMAAVAGMSWTPANAVYCVNPLSIANYVAKARAINRNNAELIKIQDEFKVRIINTCDRIHGLDEKQKHVCCAWYDFKRKSIDAVPDEAKDFLTQYFEAFFKMHELVFCQQYTDGCAECESLQFSDDEPNRMIARSWITHVIELLIQYI